MKTFKDQTATIGLSPKEIDSLNRMFCSEQQYKKHMCNLHTTIKGLQTIMINHPDLHEAIRPQFDTINDLLGALLSDFPTGKREHPWHD